MCKCSQSPLSECRRYYPCNAGPDMDLAGLCREQQVQALSLNLFAVGKRAAPLGLMSGSGKLRHRVARFGQCLLRARSISVTGGGNRTFAALCSKGSYAQKAYFAKLRERSRTDIHGPCHRCIAAFPKQTLEQVRSNLTQRRSAMRNLVAIRNTTTIKSLTAKTPLHLATQFDGNFFG
jgi:hypothetical protein